MLTKILTIAAIIAVVLIVLKLLKASAKVINFVVWLLVVSFLVYLILPFLDPFLQKIAVEIVNGKSCYGLVLESGDCFGLVL